MTTSTPPPPPPPPLLPALLQPQTSSVARIRLLVRVLTTRMIRLHGQMNGGLLLLHPYHHMIPCQVELV